MKQVFALAVFVLAAGPAVSADRTVSSIPDLAAPVFRQGPISAAAERAVAGLELNADQVCPPGFDCTSTKPQPKRKKEKFFSATNILMGVGLFGSAAADLETTFTCLGTTGRTETPLPDGSTYVETRWCYESNSRFRPFIEAGRGGAYGGKALMNVPFWVGSHFMRRSNNKTVRVIGWVVPIVAIGVQSKLAIDNKRVTDFVRTGR